MEFKGFTYGYDGNHGEWRSEEGIRSQELLYKTGVNWVCLCVVLNQSDAVSTDISFDFKQSNTDRDVMAAIKRAHDHGVKVCLKPMVNCLDATWRARIDFPDLDPDEGEEDIYWNKWFDAYSGFMKYYAELGQECGAEMLCVGCEMCGTERKEKHWRKLLTEIRDLYKGKLIYNTNHGHEGDVKWFDMVDYVGTSAYFPVGKDGAVKDKMMANWENVSKELEVISKQWNKKIVFIEIGCRSADTCSSMPWDFSHKDLPVNQDEQALFYDTCLETFSGKDWFGGMFWWDWSTFIYDDEETASKDVGFNIHLKKAEKVLKDWYAKL